MNLGFFGKPVYRDGNFVLLLFESLYCGIVICWTNLL